MADINPTTAPAKMKVVYSPIEDMTFSDGRRSWIRYRDLGVKDATNGAMSVEIMHIDDATGARPTGWHYHTAELQFIYMIDGWVKFEFPDLGVITVKTGESIMVPGGTIHQELKSSDPMRLLEVFSQAKYETVNVGSPVWSKEQASDYGEVEPVRNF